MPDLSCNCARSAHLTKVIRDTGEGFTEALQLLLLRPSTFSAHDRVLLESLLAVAQNLKVCPL